MLIQIIRNILFQIMNGRMWPGLMTAVTSAYILTEFYVIQKLRRETSIGQNYRLLTAE